MIGEGVQVISTVFVFVSYCLIEINTATDGRTDRQLPYKAQEINQSLIQEKYEMVRMNSHAVVSLSVSKVAQRVAKRETTAV